MPNPFGRPAGSKNSKGHDAGGSRANSGRKKKMSEEEKNEAALKTSWEEGHAEIRRAEVDKDRERREGERRQRLQEMHRNAIEVLRGQALEVDVPANETGEEEGNNADADEDDSIEDYFIIDAEDSDDPVKKTRRKYQDRSYMPAAGSQLFKEMEKFKNTIKDNKLATQMKVQQFMWHENNCADPVAVFSTSRKPDRFYSANFHPFVWIPTRQFPNLVCLQEMKCVRKDCSCAQGKLKLDKYIWRPMFYFDRIVWVLHHSILCGACNRRFPSIHPHFLAQLPTKVVERFPFVAPMRGPGVHQMMIFQSVNLLTKQIGFGTYASCINEMHRIRHSQDMVSYYDCVFDKMEGEESLQATSGVYPVSLKISDCSLSKHVIINK